MAHSRKGILLVSIVSLVLILCVSAFGGCDVSGNGPADGVRPDSGTEPPAPPAPPEPPAPPAPPAPPSSPANYRTCHGDWVFNENPEAGTAELTGRGAERWDCEFRTLTRNEDGTYTGTDAEGYAWIVSRDESGKLTISDCADDWDVDDTVTVLTPEADGTLTFTKSYYTYYEKNGDVYTDYCGEDSYDCEFVENPDGTASFDGEALVRNADGSYSYADKEDYRSPEGVHTIFRDEERITLKSTRTAITDTDGWGYAPDPARGVYAVIGTANRDADRLTIPPEFRGAPVTSIEEGAFAGCAALASISIPASVVRIYFDAHWGLFPACGNLETLTVDSANAVYRVEGNCLIEKETNKLIAGCKASVIPSSVTCVGDGAFADCSSLTSITIPNSVTSIDRWAFYGCTSLTSLTLPASVMRIGGYAFDECTSLEDIAFSGTKEQWEAIGKDYCWNCGVPATVVHCSDGDVSIEEE